MAEFNYSDYVAKMAQRKGPMHEMDTDHSDANQITNSYLNHSIYLGLRMLPIEQPPLYLF